MKALFRLLAVVLLASAAVLPRSHAQSTGGPAVYSLKITAPVSGAAFPAGAPVPVDAVAISSGTAVYSLDFLADGKVVGNSTILTLVAVPPGVPVFHHFDWKDAAPGTHALAVRHTDANGQQHESAPVKVLVQSTGPAGPSLVWNSPEEGAVVPTPGVVPLTVTTTDPLGEIRRVEFREAGVLLGVAEILTKDAIIPGRPRTLTWPWTNPPAGPHAVVAWAKSADGTVLEVPRKLTARGAATDTVVTVAATKALATETGDLKSRTLVFEFTRKGDLSRNLMVFFTNGGTATPTVDYVSGSDVNGVPNPVVATGTVLIPAGQATGYLYYTAVADNVREGAESVVVTLIPSPMAGPLPTYVIGEPGAAKGVIEDGSVGPAASLVWRKPANGDHFPAGQPVEFVVAATDPGGLLWHVDYFAGDRPIGSSDWNCPTCKFAPGATIEHTFVWKDAPVGVHTLRAEAVDASGAKVVSAPVTVQVDPVSPPKPAAFRHLPGGFAGGQPFKVSIDVVPPAGAQAWVVMERPPFLHTGGAVPPPDMPWWQVTRIEGGVFDAANGLVKFGPYFGGEPRTLVYEVTPNDAVVERAGFDGQLVVDGVPTPVGGDVVVLGSQRHPADVAPADDWMKAEELTAYAAAWRLGKPWNGQKIPVDHVTRAGELWQQGEHYRFDPAAGPAPLCWVPAPFLVPLGGGVGDGAIPVEGVVPEPAYWGLATARWTAAGAESVLEIRTVPGPGVSAHALELKVARAPRQVGDSGVYDAAAGVVRWGPFTDGSGRTLHCTFDSTARVGFAGIASFAGHPVPVTGEAGVAGGASGPRLLGVAPGSGGSMQVVAEDVAGSAALRLEYSTDLRHWTPLGDFTPGSAAFAKDAMPASDVPRFYRAVRKE